MDFFNRVFEQIQEFVTGLSLSRKIALGAVGFVVIVGLVLMFKWAGNQAYQPLTHGSMNSEDSGNVMRLLREKKIPFQVDPQGKSVLVPPEYLHDLRLELAMQGMPQSSGVGYELFDKQAFGTTNFLNKVNQKRALEGELMRSINTIKGVKRSRVHLAIPEKSAFVEDQKKPTASVVLDLEPGMLLNEKQIFGIGNLVARAVEGLDTSDVMIVDSLGKALTKGNRDSLVALTAEQSEIKRKIEDDAAQRIEDILGRVVGAGRVRAMVTVDLDFSNVSESQTILDQDGATVKSTQKSSETAQQNRGPAQGTVGAVPNTPGENVQTGAGGLGSRTAQNNEVINYEIPKTTRTTRKSVGDIKKLSVAVVIDDKRVTTQDTDGKSITKSEPWSSEKIKEFEQIVAGSLAIDKKRGDTLDIKTMTFAQEDFEEAQKILDQANWRGYIQSLIVYGIMGVIVLLFFFFVVRPYIRWITENTTESVDTFLPQTIEELEKIQKSSTMAQLDEVVPEIPDRIDPERVEGEMIREKIVTMIDSNPHKASLIVKEWLSQSRPGAAGGDAKPAEKAKTA